MVWFMGDLGDPWVAAIADALPRDVTRLDCAGDWTEAWPSGSPLPRTLILHRPTLTARDAERLARFRAGRQPLRVILCIGPYARYAELERWSGLVDAIVSEATARDTLGRHLTDDGDGDGEASRPSGPRSRVSIVSTNFELRQALAEACGAAGYAATPTPDWSGAAPGGLRVWDVPVLEPGWPEDLARQVRGGPVVALLGFADRGLVRQARASGAAACLELPCDTADLVFVLDRLSPLRGEPGHDLPPPPTARRRLAGDSSGRPSSRSSGNR